MPELNGFTTSILFSLLSILILSYIHGSSKNSKKIWSYINHMSVYWNLNTFETLSQLIYDIYLKPIFATNMSTFTARTPKKRSMKQLQSVSPTKSTNTRKLVYVQAGVLADGTIAFVKAKTEGRQDVKPFTNPARAAILSGMGTNGTDNALVKAGFFLVASMTLNEGTDTALRTSRGYDYKVFVASVEGNLARNNSAPLKTLAEKFCEVSMF